MIGVSTLFWVLEGHAASRIYKTVDEHGNVVFTDVPPKQGEPAESVAVEAPNTFRAEPETPTTGEQREQWIVEPDEDAEDADADAISYNAIAITAPGDDEAVRENAGTVTVVARVDPSLRPGHRVRVLLDGNPEQEGRQTNFVLTNVDRGTHALSAEVVDDTGNVLIVSAPSTFHMLRATAARPSPSN